MNASPVIKKKFIKNLPLYVGLILAVIVLVEMQKRAGGGGCAGGTCFFAPKTSAPQPAMTTVAHEEKARTLPLLVDLGASKCIPCKMMKPTLDELKVEYADQFETRFIDVSQNPQAGEQYGIRIIPTQIFFDADGNELFRHEGYMAKEDILAKWAELGIDLSGE